MTDKQELHAFSRQFKKGHITDTREAWIAVKGFELILFIGDEEEYLEKRPARRGETDAIKLELRQPNRRTFKVDLTGLTAAELRALAVFFEHAYKLALPVSEDLDKKAQEAFEAGDDSYARLYRPEPVVYKREVREGKRIAVPFKGEA